MTSGAFVFNLLFFENLLAIQLW